MAIFSPMMRLSSVDFPALGRPTIETYPAFIANIRAAIDATSWWSRMRNRRRFSDPHLVDAAALGLEHFDREAVDLERLADRRNAADARQDVPPDRLEPTGLDLEVEALAQVVEAHLGAEDERSISLFDDRLRLHIVFVTDLADDLFEQIFDRDEPRGAAVLVDDDRHLDLLALELLEQLRHPLGFGHEGRGTDQRDDRVGRVVIQLEEVLDANHAKDVVEVLFVDREPRVLLLAKERAQLRHGRAFRHGDNVGPRRHHFAHQRAAEIND